MHVQPRLPITGAGACTLSGAHGAHVDVPDIFADLELPGEVVAFAWRSWSTTGMHSCCLQVPTLRKLLLYPCLDAQLAA
jgi:hypothetical protein